MDRKRVGERWASRLLEEVEAEKNGHSRAIWKVRSRTCCWIGEGRGEEGACRGWLPRFSRLTEKVVMPSPGQKGVEEKPGGK